MKMPYKLSPNTLNLFKECPKCFWLSVNKKLKRPETPFPSLPSGMDKVLKAHFDVYRAKGTLPPELKELREVKLFDGKQLETWRNNRKGITWTDESGNVLYGAVDDLLEKGKKLVVLDYKTRGFPLKEDSGIYYQNQLNIYNLLLRKNGYTTEDFSYLLFYHPKNVDTVKGYVLFHTDLKKMDIDVSKAESLFKNALEVLVGEMPYSSETCSFCNWYKERNK